MGGDEFVSSQPDMTNLTPEYIELRRLEIEAETKRREITAGIWKIALGTMLVGIAAAAFPFLQTYATEYFAVQIQTMRQDAASKIKIREQATAETTLNREFLASVAREGRSKNLEDRIILAEYYYYLANDGNERDRWDTFLKHLIGLREAERAAAVEAIKVATNPESTAMQIEIARETARQLKASSEAGGSKAEATKPVADADVVSLIEDLSSDVTDTRRGARTVLASKGLTLVRPAMIALSEDGISYRLRLGLIVALNEMMRENKGQRRLISELLQPDDLERLLVAATDPDRTIRIYAAGFLFDLGDPRSFDQALGAWSGVNSENGLYNLALILKGAAPALPTARVAAARQELNALKDNVGPKTDSLLDDAIGLLPG